VTGDRGRLAVLLVDVGAGRRRGDSVALGIVGLVTSRNELLARLRETTPTGMPLLTEATAMIEAYLAAERTPVASLPTRTSRPLRPCSSAPGICSSPAGG
jgi:hypothetical protein